MTNIVKFYQKVLEFQICISITSIDLGPMFDILSTGCYDSVRDTISLTDKWLCSFTSWHIIFDTPSSTVRVGTFFLMIDFCLNFSLQCSLTSLESQVLKHFFTFPGTVRSVVSAIMFKLFLLMGDGFFKIDGFHFSVCRDSSSCLC